MRRFPPFLARLTIVTLAGWCTGSCNQQDVGPICRALDRKDQWSAWLKNNPRISMVHYCDVIMSTIASQITSFTIVYSTVYSDADQRKPQSSASLAFVRGIHRGPVNSPRKWPVTRKMFPLDDVIMSCWYSSDCGDHSSYDHTRWRTSVTVSSGRARLWHLHAPETHNLH